jgi:hypothetical protein
MRAAREVTFAGQVDWATGPHRCGRCRHWQPAGRRREGYCGKATQLNGEHGAKVPDFALSCKYFEGV